MRDKFSVSKCCCTSCTIESNSHTLSYGNGSIVTEDSSVLANTVYAEVVFDTWATADSYTLTIGNYSLIIEKVSTDWYTARLTFGGTNSVYCCQGIGDDCAMELYRPKTLKLYICDDIIEGYIQEVSSTIRQFTATVTNTNADEIAEFSYTGAADNFDVTFSYYYFNYTNEELNLDCTGICPTYCQQCVEGSVPAKIRVTIDELHYGSNYSVEPNIILDPCCMPPPIGIICPNYFYACTYDWTGSSYEMTHNGSYWIKTDGNILCYYWLGGYPVAIQVVIRIYCPGTSYPVGYPNTLYSVYVRTIFPMYIGGSLFTTSTGGLGTPGGMTGPGFTQTEYISVGSEPYNCSGPFVITFSRPALLDSAVFTRADCTTSIFDKYAKMLSYTLAIKQITIETLC